MVHLPDMIALLNWCVTNALIYQCFSFSFFAVNDFLNSNFMKHRLNINKDILCYLVKTMIKILSNL